MNNLDTNDLLQFFGEDKKIKEDAPIDYKFISHLTEVYNTDRLMNRINDYIGTHPKFIDIKITDITKLILDHSADSAASLQEDMQRLIDESHDIIKTLEEAKEKIQ